MNTNTKHLAAVAASAAQVVEYRALILTQLHTIAGLDQLLTALHSTRQSIGTAATTEATRRRADEQARDERAAARGQVGRNDLLGQGWMNATARLGTGQVPTPVTMAAASVSVEILRTLQHHIIRLGARDLPAAQAQARAALLAGPSPQPATYTLAGLPTITTDAPTPVLVRHLATLTRYSTNRRALVNLLRDLDHLTDVARQVVDGPAKTPHPAPCPWCGRHTLVVHHRTPGRLDAYIRCIGTHRCECDYEWCECHRQPHKNRHEWVNSGRARDTWRDLDTLQTEIQETAIRETHAIDAIGRVLALHAEVPIHPPATDDCYALAHELTGHLGEDHCTTCDPVATVCGHCIDTDSWRLPYPCPTVQTIQPTATAQEG